MPQTRACKGGARDWWQAVNAQTRYLISPDLVTLLKPSSSNTYLDFTGIVKVVKAIFSEE